jgi:hypothetical protein
MSVTTREASTSDLRLLGELERHVSPDVVSAGRVIVGSQRPNVREVGA